MKTMPHLNPKLGLIASFVRSGLTAADIGCDHALLAINLVQAGVAKKCFACDISEGSLKKAASNIKKYGLAGQIETILCDGAKGLEPNEIDDVIIAGIGPDVISKIIEEAAWLRDPQKNLVLSPASKPHVLRKYLAAAGFGVLQEEAVLSDGRYYTVMLARFDAAVPKDEYFFYRSCFDLQKEANFGFLSKQLVFLKEKARFETPNGGTALKKIAERLEEELEQYGNSKRGI